MITNAQLTEAVADGVVLGTVLGFVALFLYNQAVHQVKWMKGDWKYLLLIIAFAVFDQIVSS